MKKSKVEVIPRALLSNAISHRMPCELQLSNIVLTRKIGCIVLSILENEGQMYDIPIGHLRFA